MTTITIIPPDQWNPYTTVDTHVLEPGGHRALRAELARRGVGQPTSGRPIRDAIGTANGHSFGLMGDHAQIVDLLRDTARSLGLEIADTDSQADVGAALDAAGPDDVVIGGRGAGPVTMPADDITDADRRVAERIATMPLEELPPGAEDRAVERARDAGLFGPPAPASPDSADAGCPACGMSGWTPEQAERFAPYYMAALRSAPSHPIPDQPAAECWDCRRLRAAGHDPEALAARDLEEYGTPYSPRGASS